jgi:hypothetical protein
VKANLFSILVFSMSKAEWEQDYGGGLLIYLDEKDGKVFAYTMPSEPSPALQGAQNMAAKVDVTKMINFDVPRIVQTFTFTK